MNKTQKTIIMAGLWLTVIVVVIFGAAVLRAYWVDALLIKQGYNATILGGQYVVGIISASYNAMPIELNFESNLTLWLEGQYRSCIHGIEYVNCAYLVRDGNIATPGIWNPMNQ